MKAVSESSKSKIMILLVAAIMFILFSSMVFAIGVSPSRQIFDYEPGKQVSYSIDIINNGNEDLEVLVYPRGEYSDKVQLDWKVFKLDKNQAKKTINVWFTIPEIDIAGPHELDIVAVGSTPTSPGIEAVVKADIAVISKLIIDVPYPDKYAEARVYVLDTEKGKPVTISIPFFNKGSIDINEAYAEVNIHDSKGSVLDTLSSEPQLVKKGKDTKFTLKSNRAFETGEYKAVAKVYYDGLQRNVETGFNIGELKMDIRSLVVNQFTIGGIANFDILIYNSWSSAINNVYAEMEITDTDNNILTKFKTVAVDIPSKDLGRLEGYWNTEGVQPGIYTSTITLYYANRVEQKAFSLEVQPNAIIATPLGTGRAISAQEEIDFTNNGYLIILVLLMGGIIAGLVYKLKKKSPVKMSDNPVDAVSDKTVAKTVSKPAVEHVEKIPEEPKPIKSEPSHTEQPLPAKSGWAAVEQKLNQDNNNKQDKNNPDKNKQDDEVPK